MMQPALAALLALAIGLLPAAARAGEAGAQPGTELVGGVASYRVQPGDSLTGIGARFGVDYRVLARDNGLALDSLLKLGQVLTVDNRHAVPAGFAEDVVINLPQRMLFHFRAGQLLAAYPVAAGKPGWPTPVAPFTIRTRERDKTWVVPPSIQAEMRAQGLEVKTRVPPGPDNPLGRYWLGLDLPGYGIHGTIAPQSIFQLRSHGCVRLHPDDIEALFGAVAIGTTGRFIYQPVLLAQPADGEVYLEVHPDAYKKGIDARSMTEELAAAAGVTDRVDWKLAAQVIAAQEGVARKVSRPADGELP